MFNYNQFNIGTRTAKHPDASNTVSNYQELNTDKERNAYESILLQ